MKRVFISAYGLFCYVAVRSSSYATQPRPYLWWHFALDLAVVALWVPGVLMVGRWLGERGTKQ